MNLLYSFFFLFRSSYHIDDVPISYIYLFVPMLNRCFIIYLTSKFDKNLLEGNPSIFHEKY